MSPEAGIMTPENFNGCPFIIAPVPVFWLVRTPYFKDNLSKG